MLDVLQRCVLQARCKLDLATSAKHHSEQGSTMWCVALWCGVSLAQRLDAHNTINVWTKLGGQFVKRIIRPKIRESSSKQEILQVLYSIQDTIGQHFTHKRPPRHLLVFAGTSRLSQLTPTGFAYDQSEFDEVSTKSVLLTTKDLHVMYNEDDSYIWQHVFASGGLYENLSAGRLVVQQRDIQYRRRYVNDPFERHEKMVIPEFEVLNYDTDGPIKHVTFGTQATHLGDLSVFGGIRSFRTTKCPALMIMLDQDYANLARLKKLVDLELGLNGTVSPKIGMLTNLETLRVNSIYTAIPSEIGLLTKLVNLKLTCFGGKAPKELGKLSNLKRLTLVRTRVTSIPSELGNLSSLCDLDVSHNHLTSIPSELGKLSNLRALNAYHNDLRSIPTTLNNLDKLVWMDFSHNLLLNGCDYAMYHGKWVGKTWKNYKPGTLYSIDFFV